MKQRGWNAEVIFEEVQPIDFSVINQADLVGVSTITSTAPRAYLIADRIRRMGIPVIMGGPHVTFLPEEALQHADYVIRGEGEIALMAFIDAWEKDEDYSSVPNLSFRRGMEIVHNPMGPFIESLNELPFPDFSLLKSRSKHLASYRTIPVQTSRGCPFDCSFCSVTGMFGKKYRFRSTENIIEELRRYNDRKNSIFFYDDNFAVNTKRAKELLEAMIKERFKFKWSTQVRVDVVKDIQLVRLMKKAGCHTLYIGFESVNPESLQEMKKGQTIKDALEAVKVLHSFRIHIHGMFVYGFDHDDWQTVKNTVKFAKKSRLNSTQFLILTPLPGSELFDRMRANNRILFNDWSLYDAHHVVFKPARLSLFGLQWSQIFSHKKFYSRVESLKKLLNFRWIDFGIAHYARKLNRLWKKRNKVFLKVLNLLTSKNKEAEIDVNYKQKISF